MKILYIPNAVVLPALSDAQRRAVLEAAGEGSELVEARTRDEQLRHVPDADVALGLMPREVYLAARRLRWVQSLSAGVDAMMYPEFVNSDITLTSEKGIVGNQLAEHAFGLLLALTRGIADIARRRSWIEDRAAFRGRFWELPGMTMGIVGLGGAGVEVAKRAQAFGMRVIAVDVEEVPKPPFVDQLWHGSRLYDLLAESDVVTVCCPLTRETKGMFNLEAFQQMKRTAILVNVTRGEIVDEAAIVQALQEGLIAGAGLDVTPREPLPPDSPLWQMDNVLIGSHTAGGSPHRAQRVVDRICENLRRLRRGEPLEGVIDKRKGY